MRRFWAMLGGTVFVLVGVGCEMPPRTLDPGSLREAVAVQTMDGGLFTPVTMESVGDFCRGDKAQLVLNGEALEPTHADVSWSGPGSSLRFELSARGLDGNEAKISADVAGVPNTEQAVFDLAETRTLVAFSADIEQEGLAPNCALSNNVGHQDLIAGHLSGVPGKELQLCLLAIVQGQTSRDAGPETTSCALQTLALEIPAVAW